MTWILAIWRSTALTVQGLELKVVTCALLNWHSRKDSNQSEAWQVSTKGTRHQLQEQT